MKKYIIVLVLISFFLLVASVVNKSGAPSTSQLEQKEDVVSQVETSKGNTIEMSGKITKIDFNSNTLRLEATNRVALVEFEDGFVGKVKVGDSIKVTGEKQYAEWEGCGESFKNTNQTMYDVLQKICKDWKINSSTIYLSTKNGIGSIVSLSSVDQQNIVPEPPKAKTSESGSYNLSDLYSKADQLWNVQIATTGKIVKVIKIDPSDSLSVAIGNQLRIEDRGYFGLVEVSSSEINKFTEGDLVIVSGQFKKVNGPNQVQIIASTVSKVGL
ncbi:MAG: hypothetical protein AAB966_03645 [Patescibacteria group bacterium]